MKFDVKRQYVLTKSDKQAGLTLLEMMIALAVAAIVLTVVAPSIQSIVGKNRIVAEINEFSSVVQFARYTAIDQSSDTVVCPAADFANCSTNWNQAKIVFIDNNGNNQRDSSEPLLMTSEAISAKNEMTGPNGSIVFFDSGATNASISVKICPDNNNAAIARSININAQGRVRVSTDSNRDGIFEDADGNPITCV